MQPYNYSVTGDNYYQFITDSGTKYACYFLSYEDYFSEYQDIASYVYAFNIEVLEPGTMDNVDARLGFTIVQLITNFLEGLTNSVVYVCDNNDSRELMRKRKFDSWFHKYDDGTIIKIDAQISLDDFEIFNAILIHKENPKKNRFIEAFTDLNTPTGSK